MVKIAMTQSELIRKLYTFTPATPYGELLKKEFNVEVPASAAAYQLEYLYKYCLQLSIDESIDTNDIVALAADKVYEHVGKYPWCKTKYDTVLTHIEKMAKADFKDMRKDNIVVFSEKYQKYMFYKDNVVACRSNTVEGLKKVVARKFGSEFELNMNMLSI